MSRNRNSWTLIFAVLCVAMASFALAEPGETPTTQGIAANTEPTVSTTFAVPKESTTVPRFSSCDRFLFNETYALNAHAFVQMLSQCVLESNTNETNVLLEVYKAIKDTNCVFTKDMEENLIGCVNKVIGFDPALTATEAKTHFGRNNTVSLVFTKQECLNSKKVHECVEETFSKQTLTTELEGCKTSLMKGFHKTAEICAQDAGQSVPGSSIRFLPCNILTLGTAVMLSKLSFYLI